MRGIHLGKNLLLKLRSPGVTVLVPCMQQLEWGRMAMVASVNTFQPYIEESAYNASKAAVINLSKYLAMA